MRTTQQLTREIRQLLTVAGSIPERRIAELAAVYTATWQQVDQRAAECLELMRLGLREKAVEKARHPTDLQEELTALAFPEVDEWLGLSETIGAPVPQSMDVTSIQTILTEVFSPDTGYDQFLRTYRRMSLGRAPLRQRIDALLKIADVDPSHQFWEEDLRSFEVAYVQELVERAEQSDEAGNREEMERILTELRTRKWVKLEPRKAVVTVERLLVPHRQKYAARRFNELAETLHAAHSAMNEAAARAGLAEWQLIVQQMKVEPHEQQRQQIAPVMAWLNELQSARQEEAGHQAACRDLERALDGGAAPARLEQCEAAVLRFPLGLPEELAARLTERKAELARAARRKTVVVTVVAASLALLLTGAVAAVMIGKGREQSRVRWTAEIATAVAADDLDTAGRLFDTIRANNAKLLAGPELLRLRSEYETKVQAETRRQAEFQKELSAVEKAGLETPDQDAMARATHLARLPKEKSLLDDWGRRISGRANDVRAAREAKYETLVKEVEECYVQAREAEPNLNGPLATKCLAMARRVVTDDRGSSLQRSRAQVVEEALLKAWAAQSQMVARQQKAAEVLARLPKLADRPDDLARELTAFVETYPEHQLAGDFSRAVQSTKQWQAAVDWHAIVKTWGGLARVSDTATALRRLDQIRQYLDKHPDGPYTAAARSCLAYLRVAHNAMVVKGPENMVALKELLNRPSMKTFLMVRLKSGSACYLENKEAVLPLTINGTVKSYQVQYIIDPVTLQKRQQLVDGAELSGSPEPAPQNALAVKLLELCGQYSASGWESLYLRLAELVRSPSGADPILRAMLLKEILTPAQDCTPGQAEKLSACLNALAGLDLNAAWMDPQDARAAEVRPKVEAVLSAMGSFDETIKEVDRQTPALSAAARSYRPVGLLFKNSPNCTSVPLRNNQAVYVLVARAGQPSQFVAIGTMQNGCLGLGAAAPDAPQGCPLFVSDQ